MNRGILKEDTLVLHFVNDREEIRDAFKLNYEGAEMENEVDPVRCSTAGQASRTIKSA